MSAETELRELCYKQISEAISNVTDGLIVNLTAKKVNNETAHLIVSDELNKAFRDEFLRLIRY